MSADDVVFGRLTNELPVEEWQSPLVFKSTIHLLRHCFYQLLKGQYSNILAVVLRQQNSIILEY